MKYIWQLIQTELDKAVQNLLLLLTGDSSDALITRFAITFLDIWQAIIIVNHNYWIPQLVAITLPVQVYTVFACGLAGLALIAIARTKALLLSAIVLGINWVMYMLLGISSLWYFDPPRASAGFSFFVMFISMAAFQRIILHMQRDRSIRKRS